MDESNQLTKKVRVKNQFGVHTRPATVIVKLLHDCTCQVFFTYKKITVNAKSLLNILTLAIPKNAMVTIQVIGEDCHEIMQGLVNQFENGFGEVDSNGA